MTLRQLATAYSEMKYRDSTVPAHCRPSHSFSEKSANDLTKAVLGWFEVKGIKAMRQSTEGRYLPGSTVENVIGQKITQKGKWIPRSKQGIGQGDIRVLLPPHGRTMEIEIKYGKDRQSDAQKKYQEELEQAGGIYLIVKSWDGFIEQIKKYVP